MQTTKEQEQIIHWSMLHEPGDGLARQIFDLRSTQALEDFQTGRAQTLWPTLVGEEYREAIADMIERIELRYNEQAVIAAIERGIRWNFRPVFPAEAPGLFQKLDDLAPHQPYLLWVAGDLLPFTGDTASVVGTRWPSDQGKENASKLVRQLGLPVISGGAIGIDAAAHKAALANKLRTLAVMAGGLDRAYPQVNWELFHQIVQSGGAMISEMAASAAPTRWRFLQRNRLIAAASSATYVVEAGYKSGSLNTANHAKMLGREVFAMVEPKEFAPARGCNAMVSSGLARPYRLGGTVIQDQSLQLRIADARRNGSKTVRDIARDSGVPIRLVKAAMR